MDRLPYLGDWYLTNSALRHRDHLANRQGRLHRALRELLQHMCHAKGHQAQGGKALHKDALEPLHLLYQQLLPVISNCPEIILSGCQPWVRREGQVDRQQCHQFLLQSWSQC